MALFNNLKILSMMKKKISTTTPYRAERKIYISFQKSSFLQNVSLELLSHLELGV
jgi:hypothetical protein